MFGDRAIAVVVPAYNEERHIADTVNGVPPFVDYIVVVDDKSLDGTAEVVLGLDDDRIDFIRHETNTGVGGAISTGHLRALDLGSQVNVVLAGDDQMDPAELPKLLAPIIEDGYGFTKGNRLYSRTSAQGMSAFRIAANMFLTFVNKASSGYWNLVDPQNGYTAVTREALELIPLDRVSQRYEFENDLLIWLNIADVRAKDVSIPARYHSEVSSIRLHRDVPRMLWLLFRGFWRRMWLKYTIWSFSPVALLFFLGIMTLGVGLVAGIWTTVIALQGTSPSAGTTVLSVVPFFCGFVLLVQALVLDIQASPD